MSLLYRGSKLVVSLVTVVLFVVIIAAIIPVATGGLSFGESDFKSSFNEGTMSYDISGVIEVRSTMPYDIDDITPDILS